MHSWKSQEEDIFDQSLDKEEEKEKAPAQKYRELTAFDGEFAKFLQETFKYLYDAVYNGEVDFEIALTEKSSELMERFTTVKDLEEIKIALREKFDYLMNIIIPGELEAEEEPPEIFKNIAQELIPDIGAQPKKSK